MNEETHEPDSAPGGSSPADDENSAQQDGMHPESTVDGRGPNTGDSDTNLDSELLNIIEAAIFASDDPVGVRKLIAMFPRNAAPSRIDIQNALLRLQQDYEGRGIELRRIGKGWRFQSREKYSEWLRQLFRGKTPRYSRALLETLAIIAYRQPVTRGDIEEVRGVTVSTETVRILLDREWVQEVGHRDVPGRPALFGTTDAFLQYFNLSSLKELPELLEPREMGEIASELNLTLPMDGVDTTDPEGSEEHTAEVIPLHPEGQDDQPEEGEIPGSVEVLEEREVQADDRSGANDSGDTPDEGEDP